MILAYDDLFGRMPGGIDHDELAVTRKSDHRGKYHTGNATPWGPRQLFSDPLVVLADGVIVVLYTLALRAIRSLPSWTSAEPGPRFGSLFGRADAIDASRRARTVGRSAATGESSVL